MLKSYWTVTLMHFPTRKILIRPDKCIFIREQTRQFVEGLLILIPVYVYSVFLRHQGCLHM
jgi:hypothetical protein